MDWRNKTPCLDQWARVQVHWFLPFVLKNDLQRRLGRLSCASVTKGAPPRQCPAGRWVEKSVFQKSTLEFGQHLLRCGIGGGYSGLCGLQPRNRLVQGRKQPVGHAAGQPETELLPVLGVQAQQQAILAFVVADRQLMNVHVLILGNTANPTLS
jgi:hypothetical protein